MLKPLLLALTLFAGMSVSAVTLAQASAGLTAVTPEIEQRLKKKIGAAIPHMAITSVKPGPFAGIYAVQLSQGPVLYTDSKGELLVAGDLYQIQGTRLVDVGALERQKERKPLLEAIDKRDMIIFPAEGETRAAVYVFTDVDCGYCRKLHQEVPALNKAGVEVRYLGYPRAGIGSESFNKLARAWCAKDPNDSLTRLKQGQRLAGDVCEDNPIAAQYQLGGRMGVRGTPAIMLESGEMIPGYKPANELLELLGVGS